MAGERRYVTILFADVSGYTRLSESMDPEDVQDLINDLFLRLRAVVEAQGGTVDKFIGDAVMAVFGAPAAHEDDPARAVRAAIAMQGVLAAWNAERGTTIRMRIGVNAGEVLWGSIGGDRATATGDAVNVAQRLEATAEPGTILVSRSVERASAMRIRFRSLGSVRLKGREEAVEAFEAVGEFSGVTEYRLAGAAPAPFIGREAELARLEAAVTARGASAALLIQGEAGVGKSRLLAELRRRIRNREGAPEVHVGRAAAAAPLPFGPFVEILRAASRVGGTGAEAAASLVEWLVAQLGVLQEPPVVLENYAHLIALSAGLEPPGSRVRFLDPARAAVETRHAWSRWLDARSAKSPLVLCLEDLHWADAATLALATALAAPPPAGAAARRFAILATSRPGTPPPAGFEVVPIDELSPADAAVLARDVLGRSIAPELAAFLAAQAGGHPLYVEELARLLDESGLIEGSPARLSGPPARVPHGLQGILTARLDALPEDVKSLLKSASVVGRVFWSGVLEAIAGDGTARLLHDAGRRRVVSPQPGSTLPGQTEYVFRHALIREAAYALLPKRDKARMHALAAAEFERRVPEGGRRALALAAAQREAAGEAGPAAALWTRVAQEARAGFSWEEALAAAKEARRLVPGPAATLAVANLLVLQSRAAEAKDLIAEVLADPASSAGQREQASLMEIRRLWSVGENAESLSIADALLAGSPGAGTRLQALVSRADTLVRVGQLRESQEAVETAEAALAASAESVPAAELARQRRMLRAVLGHVHLLRGDYPAALAVCLQAAALAREAGDLQGLAAAQGNVALLAMETRRFDEARAALDEARELFTRMGDRQGVMNAAQALANFSSSLGRWEEAAVRYAEARRLSIELGNSLGEAVALTGLAMSAFERGRVAESAAFYESSLQIRRNLGNLTGQCSGLYGLGRSKRFAGDLAGAEECLREAADIARRMASPQYVTSVLMEQAQLLADQGRLREAEAAAVEGVSSAAKNPRHHDIVWSRIFLARIRASHGEPLALEDVARAEAGAAELGMPGVAAVVQAVKARVAAMTGKTTEAKAALTASLAELTGSSPSSLLAREDAALAAALLGDPETAKRVALEGERIARENGCPLLEKRFAALLATPPVSLLPPRQRP